MEPLHTMTYGLEIQVELVYNTTTTTLDKLQNTDITNVRDSLPREVQKKVEHFNSNASGAAKVQVSLGPGLKTEGKVFNTGWDYEISGPHVIGSTNLGGELQRKASVATSTLKTELGPAKGELEGTFGVFAV
jgi:hypothetical protein